MQRSQLRASRKSVPAWNTAGAERIVEVRERRRSSGAASRDPAGSGPAGRSRRSRPPPAASVLVLREERVDAGLAGAGEDRPHARDPERLDLRAGLRPEPRLVGREARDERGPLLERERAPRRRRGAARRRPARARRSRPPRPGSRPERAGARGRARRARAGTRRRPRPRPRDPSRRARPNSGSLRLSARRRIGAPWRRAGSGRRSRPPSRAPPGARVRHRRASPIRRHDPVGSPPVGATSPRTRAASAKNARPGPGRRRACRSGPPCRRIVAITSSRSWPRLEVPRGLRRTTPSPLKSVFSNTFVVSATSATRIAAASGRPTCASTCRAAPSAAFPSGVSSRIASSGERVRAEEDERPRRAAGPRRTGSPRGPRARARARPGPRSRRSRVRASSSSPRVGQESATQSF